MGQKYIKYAIDEIFLVVVGILIAFQVNNWKEESKDYKGLFNNRRFENTITKLELIYIAAKRRTLGLIQTTDSIIHTIDEDLKSR